jgi:hypothetical protein
VRRRARRAGKSWRNGNFWQGGGNVHFGVEIDARADRRSGAFRLDPPAGQALLPIAGRTLLQRVHAVAQAAVLAGDCAVVVATDDARIADHARSIGAAVTMTDAALDSARPAPMPLPWRSRRHRNW